MKIATSTDWKNLPLPSQHKTIALHRRFSPRQMHRIGAGTIPQQMEDKWFIYFLDNQLFFHRSWTGFCMYVVRFENDGNGSRMLSADVNRDPSQYDRIDDARDAQMISYLIDVVLLHEEATFPTDQSDAGKAALQNWAIVGRAMFKKKRKRS